MQHATAAASAIDLIIPGFMFVSSNTARDLLSLWTLFLREALAPEQQQAISCHDGSTRRGFLLAQHIQTFSRARHTAQCRDSFCHRLPSFRLSRRYHSRCGAAVGAHWMDGCRSVLRAQRIPDCVATLQALPYRRASRPL